MDNARRNRRQEGAAYLRLLQHLHHRPLEDDGGCFLRSSTVLASLPLPAISMSIFSASQYVSTLMAGPPRLPHVNSVVSAQAAIYLWHRNNVLYKPKLRGNGVAA